MKLAEKVLGKIPKEKVNEDMYSNSSINIKVGDATVGIRVNLNIGKVYHPCNGPSDGIEMTEKEHLDLQSRVHATLKQDMDLFMKSATEKLKALQG